MEPDADRLRKELIESLGVRLEGWRRLEEKLTEAYTAEAGGFEFFEDLALLPRAVSSDLILGASRAVEVNLAEARLHETAYGELAAPGRGFASTVADSEVEMRMTAEVVAVFRACGSALDCVAAVCIGLLRVPSSIRRASFSRVRRLGVDQAPSDAHSTLWKQLDALIKQGDEPAGWIDWALELRNAYLHRGRPLQILVQRELDMPRLYLPPDALREVTLERLRADPHLPSRPWIPDMDQMAEAKTRVGDTILNEPATVTLRSLSEVVQALVESVGNWLVTAWEEHVTLREAPAQAWDLEIERFQRFAGFTSEYAGLEYGAMAISPRDAERVKLAQRIRAELRSGA
jgi:hypothetical protein